MTTPCPNPSRRQFLKAAAATAAPLIIPASALGRNRPAPSERVIRFDTTKFSRRAPYRARRFASAIANAESGSGKKEPQTVELEWKERAAEVIGNRVARCGNAAIC